MCGNRGKIETYRMCILVDDRNYEAMKLHSETGKEESLFQMLREQHSKRGSEHRKAWAALSLCTSVEQVSTENAT